MFVVALPKFVHFEHRQQQINIDFRVKMCVCVGGGEVLWKSFKSRDIGGLFFVEVRGGVKRISTKRDYANCVVFFSVLAILTQ